MTLFFFIAVESCICYLDRVSDTAEIELLVVSLAMNVPESRLPTHWLVSFFSVQLGMTMG